MLKKGTVRAHPAVQKTETVRAHLAVLKKGTVRGPHACKKGGGGQFPERNMQGEGLFSNRPNIRVFSKNINVHVKNFKGFGKSI